MGSSATDLPDLEKGLPCNQHTRTESSSPSEPTLWAQSTPSPPTRSFPWCLRMRDEQALDPAREPQYRKLDCRERSYRTLATFLDSDENFMLYRRFGYLHSRMLLRLQDKLRVLESILDDHDDEDASEETHKRLLMSRDLDEAACKTLLKQEPAVQTRTQILDEIEVVLGKYERRSDNLARWQRNGSLRLLYGKAASDFSLSTTAVLLSLLVLPVFALYKLLKRDPDEKAYTILRGSNGVL
ncbi:hypothetical protein SCARD494_09956 [Seiridium cardinale]